MKSSFYIEKDDYHIKHVWLEIDVRVALHEAADFPLIPFDESRRLGMEYVDNACDLIGRSRGMPRGGIEKDDKQKIIAALGPPPSQSYSIYVISVANPDGDGERVVYVGKTNSKNHRFRGGHAALSKLHHSKYDGKLKQLYFGFVTAVNDDDHAFPVEWIHPLDSRERILSSVEGQLIFELQPELNDKGKAKNIAPMQISIFVQQTEGHLLDADHFGPESDEV
jgi:hypothetical protein